MCVCVKRSLPIRTILRFPALLMDRYFAQQSRDGAALAHFTDAHRNQISTFSNSSYYDRRYLHRIKFHFYINM